MAVELFGTQTTKISKIPLFSKIIALNSKYKTILTVNFDKTSKKIEVLTRENLKEEKNEQYIEFKNYLSSKTGFEPYGYFTTGVQANQAKYTYFLSYFSMTSNGKIKKTHLLLDTNLKNMGFEALLLLSAESFIILNLIFQNIFEFYPRKIKSIPELKLFQFINRKYTFQELNTILSGEKLSINHDDILNNYFNKINATLIELNNKIEKINSNYAINNLELYFITFGGSEFGRLTFIGESGQIRIETLQNITHANFKNSGIYMGENEVITSWFSFTKLNIEKIDRLFKTTLTSLSYAKSKRVKKRQTEKNTAQKFQELVNTLSVNTEKGVLKLSTKLGFLAFSVRLSEKSKDKIEEYLTVVNELSLYMKKYGQAILAYLQKADYFKPIWG